MCIRLGADPTYKFTQQFTHEPKVPFRRLNHLSTSSAAETRVTNCQRKLDRHVNTSNKAGHPSTVAPPGLFCQGLGQIKQNGWKTQI